MFDFWINFFRLTRPLSGAKNVAVISLAFFMSGVPSNWSLLIFGAIALSLIFSAAYTYNAFSDERADKNNENKKHYSEAVQYFGHKKILVIATILAVLGLLVGLAINLYVFLVLVVLVLTNFFYSSGKYRFKERFILDVLFGSSLTILLRFVASWLVFTVSFPPILPMFALIFLKNGGYILYKSHDRQFLVQSGVKNSITKFSQKAIIIISATSFALSIILFSALCLNDKYFQFSYLGQLPFKLILLLPFLIIAAATQYLLVFKKIRVRAKYLRAVGLFCLLAITVIVLIMVK